jgi:hypothetical protein
MNNRQLDEEAVFHIARQLASADARATYLDQVCAGDASLRERVEALLTIHSGVPTCFMASMTSVDLAAVMLSVWVSS